VDYIGIYLTESDKFQHKQVAGGTRPKKPVRKVTELELGYSMFATSTHKALLRLAGITISPRYSEALSKTTRKLKKITSHLDSKVLLGDGGECGVVRV